MTDFTARTVQVRADMDDASQVKCLAHERAHVALGHGDRDRGNVHRGIGEVEAESVAMMLTAAYGMDSDGYSVPYVSGWSTTIEDTKPVDVVRATGERVRKTAMGILSALPEPPTGDGSPPVLARRADLQVSPGHVPLPGEVRPAHELSRPVVLGP